MDYFLFLEAEHLDGFLIVRGNLGFFQRLLFLLAFLLSMGGALLKLKKSFIIFADLLGICNLLIFGLLLDLAEDLLSWFDENLFKIL